MTAPIRFMATCENSRRLKEAIWPLSLINRWPIRAEIVHNKDILTIFPKKKLTKNKIPFFTPFEWNTT